MAICNCSLAGTEACKNCPNHISFGEQIIGFTSRSKFYEVERRPKDNWIDCSEDGYVECPFCHEATNCDGNIEELHYCWNCGAELGVDVRGEE